ncbi:hypothetical protein [Glutamicibacter sp. 2E12]|uniref:hypothetical protein n=1 Tax=Glutamicibacter sp. 2E12 TaxID=3416181 RepID=UPI003CF5B2E8
MEEQMEPDGAAGSSIDVWSMPSQGLAWYDCGKGHELTEEIVLQAMAAAGFGPGRPLAHGQLAELIADLWHYSQVCRFFHLAVEQAAMRIHGKVDEIYPWEHSTDIVGYFSKTWQGCPDAACQSEG